MNLSHRRKVKDASSTLANSDVLEQIQDELHSAGL